jgi:hypothetical protein
LVKLGDLVMVVVMPVVVHSSGISAAAECKTSADEDKE